MSKFDDIAAFENVANHIKELTSSPKVHKLANEALKHIGTAKEFASAPDSMKSSGGITQALEEASHHITAAHKIISGNMGTDTPADVLQVAHLGETNTLHQSVVDEINEGKKNGR